MTNKLNIKQIMTAAAMAAAVSAIINAILFFLFHGIGWLTDDIFIQPNQALTVMPVIFASIIPTFVAALVFFLFEKFSKNGFQIFSILSIVLMLLSFFSPFKSIPNVTMQFASALCLMHIVVPMVLLYFLNRSKKSVANPA